MKTTFFALALMCISVSAAASNDNAVSEACILGESNDNADLSADDRIAMCSQWMEEDQPARTLALLYRAEAYVEQKQWKEAFQDYSEMLELDAGSPTAWYNRGGLRARHFGQIEEAISDISKAVALTQDRPRARYFLHRAAANGRLIEQGTRTEIQNLESLRSIRSDLETFLALTDRKSWEEERRAAAKDALAYVTARLKASE